jgi:hypothetical protein
MNIQDFKASLKYLFEAELTPFVWGHKGIGKTTVPKEYAKEMGWKFFPLYLGTQSDLGDVLGLAEFVDNGDGSKSTAFAKPQWMQEIITYCEQNPESGAIVFLDEFNRGRRDILSGMFSLALDKTFHTVKLPKNCHIMAAGNPTTDEYFVTDINDSALMSRFVHIKLEPTFREWLDYAKATEIDSSLIGFVNNQPELLEDKNQEFNLSSMVKVDRRAFSRLDRLFKLNTPQHILEQLMHGIIGLERTVAYLQYKKDQDKPLTAQEVYTKQKFHLVEKWNNPNDINASYLNLTYDSLIEDFITREEKEEYLNDRDMKNFMEFIRITPKDISYLFITKVLRNKIWKKFELNDKYQSELTALARSVRIKDKNDNTR